MNKQIGTVMAVLAMAAMTFAMPAAANDVEELQCLDNRLSSQQRTAIGTLFAEQTDDPLAKRTLANGSSLASQALAEAIGGCADLFSWSEVERRAATQYLLAQAELSRLSEEKGMIWAAAMEGYAPFGSRILPSEGEVSAHQRAMLAGGARSNGVPSHSNDELKDSDILAYVLQYRRVEVAKRAFAITGARTID